MVGWMCRTLEPAWQNYSIYSVYNTVACINIEGDYARFVVWRIPPSFLIDFVPTVRASGTCVLIIFHQKKITAAILQIILVEDIALVNMIKQQILKSVHREIFDMIDIAVVQEILKGSIMGNEYCIMVFVRNEYFVKTYIIQCIGKAGKGVCVAY
jgi:hypothetical protein